MAYFGSVIGSPALPVQPSCTVCGSHVGGLHRDGCAFQAMVERFMRSLNDPRPVASPTISGDPDGPIVPLPQRQPPQRVVPEFPLSAYRALVGE